MKINITSQQYNSILKRKEIVFEVKHEEKKGTPSRLEIRKKLAETLKTNIELLYVRRVETKTGTMLASGEANLHDSLEQVKLVEQEYIIARNSPAEKPAKEPTEEKKPIEEKKE